MCSRHEPLNGADSAAPVAERAVPVIIAGAAGWPGDWHGVLTEVVSKEPLKTVEHDRCPHRHRRMHKARECASDRAPAFWTRWKAGGGDR